jgi:hypothetical protein
MQYLMEEYQSTGSSEFWKKWSMNGKKCTSSDILIGLKKERKGRDNADVASAKERLGADYDATFSYRKGGMKLRMVSKHAIARPDKVLYSNVRMGTVDLIYLLLPGPSRFPDATILDSIL